MATITVRDLPDRTKETLRIQAAQSGVSLEAYVRRLLQHASSHRSPRATPISALAEQYFGTHHGVDLVLPERGTKRRPPEFTT